LSLNQNDVKVLRGASNDIYMVAQKSYCTLTTSSLSIDQIHNILSVNSVRRLLLSGMHTTPIVSLLYLVKHKYPKTNNFYRAAEGLVVHF